MERWLKVVLGTLFSSVGCVVFFFIYDKILVYFRSKRHEHVGTRTETVTMKQIFRKDKGEEMENLIYEEFDSAKHEVLCVCLENPTRAVGISIFLADREIEWYIESFPECCVEKSGEQDYKYRNLLAAVAHWGPKWTYAEAVNLLSQDGEVVRSVGKGTTRQWRSLAQYEKKHSFRLFLQWSENYVCDEAANDELWEEAVNTVKHMLGGKSGTEADVWENLPVAKWKRTRVRIPSDKFHLVPHPGEITPDEREEGRRETLNSVSDVFVGGAGGVSVHPEEVLEARNGLVSGGGAVDLLVAGGGRQSLLSETDSVFNLVEL